MQKMEDIKEDVEEAAEAQVKNFVKEIGKYVAVGLLWTLSLIVGSGYISASDIAVLGVATAFLFASGAVLVIVSWAYKRIQKIEVKLRVIEKRNTTDLRQFAIVQQKIANAYQGEVEKVQTRMKGIEDNSLYAILEYNVETGRILKTNKKFIDTFGLDASELNSLASGEKKPIKALSIVTNSFVHPSDQGIVLEKMKARVEKRNLDLFEYRIFVRDKNGKTLKVDIKTHVVQDEKFNCIGQVFIHDITDDQDKDETILAQRLMIDNLMRSFSKTHIDKQEADKILKRIRSGKI